MNNTYEKINTSENSADLAAFLQGCMTENLNHARHIETEIHTFTGIYMAVVAGVLGFGFSINSDGLSGEEVTISPSFWINLLPIVMYIILILGGNLAVSLLSRWYDAFDRHMVYAEKSYYMAEALLLRDKNPEDVIKMWDWSLDELAALADLDPIFAFKHPKKPGVKSTRSMILKFFNTIIVLLVVATLITIGLAIVVIAESGAIPIG